MDDAITTSELRDALNACWRSLHATGYSVIADGRLLDTMRRVEAFAPDKIATQYEEIYKGLLTGVER